MSEDFEISSRYRRFLVTGIGRTIFTRIFSLLYIFFVSRQIPEKTQDIMIVLANSEYLTVRIALFGLTYALTQQSITKKYSDIKLDQVGFTSFLSGIPVVLLGGFVSIIFISTNTIESVLFMITIILSHLFSILLIMQDAKVRSDLSLLGRAIYSIANSILVPTLFFFNEELLSIIIAWISALLIGLIFNYKLLKSMLSNFGTDFHETFEIIRFGFPIYVVTIIALLVERADPYILYYFFEEGETAQYFWAVRIASITQEIFMNMLTGLLPLFSTYITKRTMAELKNLINSVMRIALFGAAVFYSLALYEADLLVIIILSRKFIDSIILVQIVIVGNVVAIVGSILNGSFGAEGARRIITKSKITSIVSRLVAISVFFKFGAVGLAIAMSVQKLVVSSYFLWVGRLKLDGIQEYARIIIFVIFAIVIAFIWPNGQTLIEITIWGLLFLFLLFGMAIIMKPLKLSDIEIIERVGGDRLKKIYPLLRKFLSQGETS